MPAETVQGNPDLSDRMRVIRKLLARAESTDYPEERDACLAKVAELVARHAIDDALLWADTAQEARDRPVERLMEVPDPYASRKVALFATVGHHHDCTVIDLGSGGLKVRRVAVLGFPGDVDRVEMLVTSLLLQLTRAMLSSRPERTTSASATAAWRRSFIAGFVGRVGERLEEARAAAVERSAATEGGASLALVLADRSVEVRAEVRRRYPRLRTQYINAGTSQGGHDAGRAAGEQASLEGGPLGSPVRGRLGA